MTEGCAPEAILDRIICWFKNKLYAIYLHMSCTTPLCVAVGVACWWLRSQLIIPPALLNNSAVGLTLHHGNMPSCCSAVTKTQPPEDCELLRVLSFSSSSHLHHTLSSSSSLPFLRNPRTFNYIMHSLVLNSNLNHYNYMSHPNLYFNLNLILNWN